MPQPPLSPTDWFTLATGLLTLLAVAFGRLPGGLRMSRAVLALTGACLLLVGGGVDMETALRAIDGEVLVLLFGLLAVNAALASAGVFRYLTAAAARRALAPRRLLVVVVVVSGVLSALFLNDTVVLMLTPLVIRLALSLGLSPIPYLLGLMLAANAGSVATVTGNPQNVLVAVHGKIGYGQFLMALGPVAVLSLLVIIGVLFALFRKELGVAGATRHVGAATPPEWPQLRRGPLVVGLSVAAGMLLAFALGVPVAVAAVVAGAGLLVSRGQASRSLLRQVDFSLLVLFAGLFVVVGAMAGTGAPQRWLLAALGDGSILDLVWVTAALSTVVSNVPAVLVLLPVVPPDAGLVVAMASTLAGNLTLVASVANLIAAESARRVGVELGFWTHARAGVPVTILTLLLGGAWLVASGAP